MPKIEKTLKCEACEGDLQVKLSEVLAGVPAVREIDVFRASDGRERQEPRAEAEIQAEKDRLAERSLGACPFCGATPPVSVQGGKVKA